MPDIKLDTYNQQFLLRYPIHKKPKNIVKNKELIKEKSFDILHI